MSPAVAVLVVLAAALLALVVAGRRAAARTRARVERVCRVGDDGIIPGAHAIALDGDPRRAALVLHGFGDTPQSVTPLCRALHEAGWTVRAPLLPGHGRSLDEFERDATAERLWEAARLELAALRDAGAGARTLLVVGQSMGAALAARLTAEEGDDDVCALVLVAPYLAMAPRVARLARLGPLWRFAVPWVDTRDDRSIRDPGARAVAIGYAAQNARTLAALERVARAGWAALPRLRVPALVVGSRHDNRVPAETLERAIARIGGPAPRVHWREDAGHVLAVDHGHAEVAREVVAFAAEHAARADTVVGRTARVSAPGVVTPAFPPSGAGTDTPPSVPLVGTDGGA